MRVIGFGLAAIFAVLTGCQKEQPVSESAKKLSPAREAPAAKLADPSPEEPSVAVDVEEDEADDQGHGEPMDEVDDVSEGAARSPKPVAADPATESGKAPEE
jgi:hypothetical protein